MARPRGSKDRRGRRLTKLELEERRTEALKYRHNRMTFQQIADELYNGDKGGAYRDVQKALRDMRQDAAEDVRKLELESIDQLERAFMRAALKGDYKAFDRVMAAKERRARYLGLDAPKDVNLGGDATTVQVVFDQALAEKRRSEPELEV